jgi:(p)ppGpp synthase/HD superfamily hydrolase
MVAATLATHDYPEVTLAAALLHDVVEDSDTTVDELRAEFGDLVADLVAALSDDESIEPYRERKDEHRGRVAAVDGDALAIYAADKLTNMTTLGAAIETEGMRVADEYDVPISLKLEVWEADAAMLRHEAPELPLLDPLGAAITRLGADLKAADPRPCT